MRPKLYMSQTLQTTKKNFEKLSGSQIFKTTIGILFNLLEVFPFVPFFVFAVLFIPSFHVLLRSYFYVSFRVWWRFPVFKVC